MSNVTNRPSAIENNGHQPGDKHTQCGDRLLMAPGDFLLNNELKSYGMANVPTRSGAGDDVTTLRRTGIGFYNRCAVTASASSAPN